MEDLHKIDAPYELTSVAAKKPPAASLRSGILNGIRLYLDGVFVDKELVKSIIHSLDGTVQQRISKQIGKYSSDAFVYV
jgi:hypothetical protein